MKRTRALVGKVESAMMMGKRGTNWTIQTGIQQIWAVRRRRKCSKLKFWEVEFGEVRGTFGYPKGILIN